MISYTVTTIPKWNPINICSYHLQEAGATPVQEIAYAMSTAIAVLDSVRDSGQVPAGVRQGRGPDLVLRQRRVRFVEEMCKMRAFVQLWDEITAERYGVTDPKQRRFRYGVQVNSLGLTEAQPENNIQRIVLEMLAVTLVQGRPRPEPCSCRRGTKHWVCPGPGISSGVCGSSRVLAFESDLLEYDDIFTGSPVIEAKVAELVAGAKEEIDRVQEMGGAVAAVESGYMKQQLVASHAARRARIEAGEDPIVGVNRFETTEDPLLADLDTAIQTVDPAVEAAAIHAIKQWREGRDELEVEVAINALKEQAATDANLMDATLACARAGVTTGEWAGALREVFGEYRAPTGVSGVVGVVEAGDALTAVRESVADTGDELGGRLRMLVGKPGLDGHSNGAEQIAVRARDAGFEVIYQGIRLTPDQIVAAAVAEDVDVVGLSILSGSHMELVPDVIQGLRDAGLTDVPVVVGGSSPTATPRSYRPQVRLQCSPPRTTTPRSSCSRSSTRSGPPTDWIRGPPEARRGQAMEDVAGDLAVTRT